MFVDFSKQDWFFLLSGAAVIAAAVVLFHFDKRKIALFLLFAGTFLLGCFVAWMNDFLSTWDEQFHAVVAKNMIQHPFQPMLYKDPVLPYDYKYWIANHIWLHKQPLFLWQIAASMSVFGVNIYGLRLPSILMHALVVLFIYRIGKISLNEKVGFYGALFFSVAHYPLEVISGIHASDHNDVAFLFYLFASIWAWFEYWRSGNRKWLILIGLFAGCAFLVKWSTGMLVFGMWGIAILVNTEKRKKLKSYVDLVISLVIAIIVLLPWQIYIFSMFPQEAGHEYMMNSKHLTECIEEHCGDFWFYFQNFTVQVGTADLLPYIFLLAFIIYLVRIRSTDFRIVIFSMVFIVYLVFSLAKTKMISYTAITLPFAYLGLAAAFDLLLAKLFHYLKPLSFQRMASIIMAAVIAFFLLNLDGIYKNHTYGRYHENELFHKKSMEKKLIDDVKKTLQGSNFVIFNTHYLSCSHICFMFFSDHIAYWFIPDPDQISLLKQQDRRIAILDFGDLPAYILNDPEIVKLPIVDKEILKDRENPK